MARGTTGAPRNAPCQETGNALSPGSGDPGDRRERARSAGRQAGARGTGRLTGIVCGRRSKYLVVAFWILAVALLGSLAGTLQADEVTIFKGIDSTLLYATLAVVIVLLLVTYRSPVLWLLPVISAGVALTAAQAVIYLLTQHANLTVNRQSEDILFVLVIGASTDYALLLIARYREELRRHADRHEAMAVALHRVGPAIIASALTVAVGMLCLLSAESGDISGLGPVAATGIGVGLIAMTTLLPAMLVIFGRRPRTVWEGTATALTLDTGRHIWWPGGLAKSPAPPGRSALTGGT